MVAWNFTGDGHVHFFVLEPDAWELGKRDPTDPVAGAGTPGAHTGVGEQHRAGYLRGLGGLVGVGAYRAIEDPVVQFRSVVLRRPGLAGRKTTEPGGELPAVSRRYHFPDVEVQRVSVVTKLQCGRHTPFTMPMA